jgi:hypothetical protein
METVHTYRYIQVTGVKTGRRRRRWQNNIKMFLRVVGLFCMGWIHVTQVPGG